MQWEFEHRSFYRNGGLCIHTMHVGETSLEIELRASAGRTDIGRLEWRDIRPGAEDMGWKPVAAWKNGRVVA